MTSFCNVSSRLLLSCSPSFLFKIESKFYATTSLLPFFFNICFRYLVIAPSNIYSLFLRYSYIQMVKWWYNVSAAKTKRSNSWQKIIPEQFLYRQYCPIIFIKQIRYNYWFLWLLYFLTASIFIYTLYERALSCECTLGTLSFLAINEFYSIQLVIHQNKTHAFIWAQKNRINTIIR